MGTYKVTKMNLKENTVILSVKFLLQGPEISGFSLFTFAQISATKILIKKNAENVIPENFK